MNKIDAIVFTSETGHTEEYAKMISQKYGLPIFNINQAKSLKKDSNIIYLGWLKIGKIVGFKKAKKFNISAVCAVGMSEDEAQLPDIKKHNKLGTTPVFYLQGGFNLNKLSGLNKFMMRAMKNTVGNVLAKKQNRTNEEEKLLDLLMNGGSCVKEENLTKLYNFLEG